jgi:hypothetical protein
VQSDGRSCTPLHGADCRLKLSESVPIDYDVQLMRMSPRLIAVAAITLAALPISSGAGQTRSNSLVIQASVVPTCAINTGTDGTVAMTCSRGGASAGVITQSGQQRGERVVAVPARTTTVVTNGPISAATDTYAAPGGKQEHQVVTVNF